jgi:hypothetical protein
LRKNPWLQLQGSLLNVRYALIATKVGSAATGQQAKCRVAYASLLRPEKSDLRIVDNAVAAQQPFGISPIVPPSPIRAAARTRRWLRDPLLRSTRRRRVFIDEEGLELSLADMARDAAAQNYHGNRSVMTTFLDAQHSPRYRNSNC